MERQTGNKMGNVIPLWVTFSFILIAPFENIYRIEQMVYVIGVAVLGINLLNRRSFKLNTSKLWVLFMLYAFVSCIWSRAENAILSLPVLYAQIIFLVLQLQFSYSRGDYEKMKVAFLIQNWILILICFANGSYMNGRLWIQSASSSADPNYLSGWFVIPLCFSVEYLFSRKKNTWCKALSVVQIVLSFYIIMQTASQSGLLTNAFAIVFATMYTFRKTVRKHPLQAVFILVSFVVGAILLVNNMPTYLLTRLAAQNTTLTGRTAIWSELSKKLLENPLGLIFGFGTSSVTMHTSSGLVAHNTFLDILFSQGVIGLTLMLVFMFSDLKMKWHTRPYAVIAMLSMSVLIFTLSAFSTRFVMLMFFLIGANIVEPEENAWKSSGKYSNL